MRTPIVVTDAERRARLARRHRLAVEARTNDVAALTDSVVALHSSDPATVYLSAMARMVTPSVEAVSAALYDDRSVVRHHAMRRTVWVFTPEVAAAANVACTRAIAAREWATFVKAADAAGIAADAAVWVELAKAEVLAAIGRAGSTSARKLAKEVPHLTVKVPMGSGNYVVDIAAHTRIVQNLGFDAAIVRGRPGGSWTNGEYSWSVMADWLGGDLDAMATDDAVADLVRRYIGAFGPVTTDDIRWWTGLAAKTVQLGLARSGLVEVQLESGERAWVLADDLEPAVSPTDRWVALLPGLDPTAMGWKERAWYLGEHTTFGGPLFDRNGNIGPTVWADGEVVGAWTQRKDGAVVRELLRPVDRATGDAIDGECARLGDLLADVRVTPRFPTPLQRALATA